MCVHVCEKVKIILYVDRGRNAPLDTFIDSLTQLELYKKKKKNYIPVLFILDGFVLFCIHRGNYVE